MQWFQAGTKESNNTITDGLFVDDAALVAPTSEDLQALLDCFVTACTAFGLKISDKKTVLMYQALANEPTTKRLKIKMNGKKLAVVEPFCHLRDHTSPEKWIWRQNSTAASVVLLAVSENCQIGTGRTGS